jgi:hypothetical protein
MRAAPVLFAAALRRPRPLLLLGESAAAIAHALGTAEGTIKNHVSSILAKFGVRDRTRAVLKALEAGLLHRPDFGRTST